MLLLFGQLFMKLCWLVQIGWCCLICRLNRFLKLFVVLLLISCRCWLLLLLCLVVLVCRLMLMLLNFFFRMILIILVMVFELQIVEVLLLRILMWLIMIVGMFVRLVKFIELLQVVGQLVMCWLLISISVWLGLRLCRLRVLVVGCQVLLQFLFWVMLVFWVCVCKVLKMLWQLWFWIFLLLIIVIGDGFFCCVWGICELVIIICFRVCFVFVVSGCVCVVGMVVCSGVVEIIVLCLEWWNCRLLLCRVCFRVWLIFSGLCIVGVCWLCINVCLKEISKLFCCEMFSSIWFSGLVVMLKVSVLVVGVGVFV